MSQSTSRGSKMKTTRDVTGIKAGAVRLGTGNTVDALDIVDALGRTMIAKKEQVGHMKKKTGSGAAVYRLTTKRGEILVAKVMFHGTSNRKVAVLKHEIEAYKIMNTITNDRDARKLHYTSISPFILRMMDVASPHPRVLLTETNRGAMSLSDLFRKRKNRLTKREIMTVVAMIAFTLEVMHRSNWRHNDLHFKNIMIVPKAHLTTGDTVRLTYVPRSKKKGASGYTLPLGEFVPLIYDFDRTFKERAPCKAQVCKSELNSAPVVKRWPWHIPGTDHEDLNVLKFVTHLRNYAENHSNNSVSNAFSRLANNANNVVPNSVNSNTWNRYRIPVDVGADGTNYELPISIGNAEELFYNSMKELKISPSRANDNTRSLLHADMRLLYG